LRPWHPGLRPGHERRRAAGSTGAPRRELIEERAVLADGAGNHRCQRMHPAHVVRGPWPPCESGCPGSGDPVRLPCEVGPQALLADPDLVEPRYAKWLGTEERVHGYWLAIHDRPRDRAGEAHPPVVPGELANLR